MTTSTLSPTPTTTSTRPGSALRRADRVLGVASVLFSGAIFGFFFAWVCSTMWGLDNADPRVAIPAMQEMNASVRNWVFFPAFFLTPAVIGAWAVVRWFTGARRSAVTGLAAALLYLFGGIVFTATLNIPMNEDLATREVPTDRAAAQQIWEAYSEPWQLRNQARTVLSGISLGLVAVALTDRRRREVDSKRV